MALVETKTLTYEKNGVNAICEFYNDFYTDKTHKDGEKIIKEITKEFYEPLRKQYIKTLKKLNQ